MNRIYPDLFIIGAPKCGTTSLATYLNERADVFVCNPKEPHYFSTDIGWHLTPDRAAYLDLFKAVDKSHRIVCDASVFYLYSDAAVPAILTFNPAAKFIVMVRNPLDMVVSMHGEARLDGTEDIADVEAAWQAQLSRSNDAGQYPPIMCYRSVAENGRLLHRLYERVARERVLVIVFDDFQKDTACEYGRVLDFLGLANDGRTCFPIHNATKPVRWYRLHKFLVRTRTILKRIGIDIHSTGLIMFFIRLSGAEKSRGRLSPEFLHILRQNFTADIQLLGNLLGRDLRPWLRGEKLHKAGN